MLIILRRQRHAPDPPDRHGARRGRDRGSRRCLPPAPAARAERPAPVVVFAIDTSGSLRPADLARARRAGGGHPGRACPPGSEVAALHVRRPGAPGGAAGRRARRRSAPRSPACGGRGATPRCTTRSTTRRRYLRDAGAGRRALVLITDGRDEDSALELEDGLAVAQQAGHPRLRRRRGPRRGARAAARRQAHRRAVRAAALDARRGRSRPASRPSTGRRRRRPPRRPGAARRGAPAPSPPRSPRPGASAAAGPRRRRSRRAPGNGARPLVWIATAIALAAGAAPRCVRRRRRAAGGRRATCRTTRPRRPCSSA